MIVTSQLPGVTDVLVAIDTLENMRIPLSVVDGNGTDAIGRIEGMMLPAMFTVVVACAGSVL